MPSSTLRLAILFLASIPLADSARGQDPPPATWREDAESWRTTVPLRSAPFPHPSGPWRDSSVLIVVPKGLSASAEVAMVVHFHGHHAVLGKTIPRKRIVEQFLASGVDAVLVVPQGPLDAASGNFGKLMAPGGLERLLGDVLTLARRDGHLDATSSRIGRVVFTSHSGGYYAIAAILRNTPLRVEAVNLFDSLYGETSTYARYARSGGRLRSNYTVSGGTVERNKALAAELGAATTFDDDTLRRTRVAIGPCAFTHGEAIYAERNYQRWLVASGLPAHHRASPRIDSTIGDGTRTVIRWDGDPARQFVVEASTEGRTWRAVTRTSGSSATVAASPYLRVRRDDDPASIPSRAYGATGSEWLVVDAFDRYYGGSWSRPRHDFAASLGSALERPFSVASRDAVAAGRVSLFRYSRVLWLLGDQSRLDVTFDPRTRSRIEDYVAAGGKLLVTGSEVGYATDASWFGRVLHVRFVADGAGTTAVGDLRIGVTYPQPWPDVLSGPATILRYATGGAAAVGLNRQIAVVGFGLETLGEADRKKALSLLTRWFDGG